MSYHPKTHRAIRNSSRLSNVSDANEESSSKGSKDSSLQEIGKILNSKHATTRKTNQYKLKTLETQLLSNLEKLGNPDVQDQAFNEIFKLFRYNKDPESLQLFMSHLIKKPIYVHKLTGYPEFEIALLNKLIYLNRK